MGNTQGRSHEDKDRKTKGKSPKGHPRKEFSPTPNRTATSNLNGPVPVNSNHRESSIHLPLKEYEVPDFLKDTQPQRHHENGTSPVVKRNLKDPDLSSRSGQGLMIPREELAMPEFLRTSDNRQGNERLQQGGNPTMVNHKSAGAQANGRVEDRGRTERQRPSSSAAKVEGKNIRDFAKLNGEQRLQDLPRYATAVHAQDQDLRNVARRQQQNGQTGDFQKKLSCASTDSLDNIVHAGTNMTGTLSSKTSSDTDSDFKARNRIIFVEAERREELGANEDMSLKRKYKKGGNKGKTKGQNGGNGMELAQRPAPSVRLHTNPGGRRKSNNWPTDTDSVQSTSSQSFTEPISTMSSEKDKFSVSVRDHGNLVLKGVNFKSNGLPSSAAKLPGTSNGLVEDVADLPSPTERNGHNTNLGYNENSPTEEARKVKRKGSLQAQLRNRLTKSEKIKPPLPRVRYDSDSTTISDHSAFEEIFPHYPRRKSTHGINTLNDLPEDILIHILSFLSTRDLCKASGVCQKWQVLCWDPVLWSTIQIANYEGSDINKVLRNILAKLAMDTQGYCITVHSVKLNGCELLSDKGLGFVARFCIDLEELDVSGCCCITSKGLHDILLNCHTLSHLDTSGCTCVNSLSAPVANGFGLGHHGTLLQLRHLDLSDCVAFDDLGMRVVGLSCGLLENLYLRRCSRVTDVGVKHIAQHCVHLKELSVSDCYKVRDFSLKEIAKNCPSLKYLSAAKCPVTDTAMKYIGKHCVKLKYLNIRGCEAVSDVGITHIVQNCLKLRSIDAGKCDITDNGLHIIGIHCPQLKKLSIRGCERVTDTGVKTIAAQCCSVQYLNLQECNLSYETFMYIRANCKNCVIEHTCPAFF